MTSKSLPRTFVNVSAALVFGYFELALRSGNVDFIQGEMARIKSLCRVMVAVGMAEYLYEDFVDETMQLFNTISQKPAVDSPYDDSPLLEAFNADDKSNAIITHFKVFLF